MALRYSICSEIFKGWPLARICSLVRSLGYEGLELAPFMFFEDARRCSAAQRSAMRATIEESGLLCSGLHWLLASPPGLHVTTNDRAVRAESWAYLAELIDFCADLGGSVLVLGSPYQRDAREGWTVEQSKARLIEGLRGLAPLAERRGVTFLIEAVSSKETNVVTRLSEAAEIVEAVGHPSIQTMFDFHNAADETGDFLGLASRHYAMIRHVHVNEADGRHPGTGGIDFVPVLRHLIRNEYKGWVSLEVFDFEAGPETIARETIEYLNKVESGVTREA